MDGGFFWAVAVLASVLVGMGKGGMPVVGMLSVPVLALAVPGTTAAGLLLPVFVVSDMVGLYAYRREFNARVLWITCSAMTLGVILGYFTAAMVPEAWVTILIGVVGLAFAANLLMRRRVVVEPQRARVAPGMFWGVIAGFTSFISHSGGPPYQVYTLSLIHISEPTRPY